MRIVLDYRPALRARTGVGELAHELARALLAEGELAARPLAAECVANRGSEDAPVAARSSAPEAPEAPDEIVLFTSSWKDRPSEQARKELAGARWVDRRVPVRLLTWAWNRCEWPPIEALAGPCDLVQSLTPLLVPARAAAQVVTVHDLDFLSHHDRTEGEMRRDFPALSARHVRRADHVIVPSEYTAAEVRTRLAVAPGRITVCSPGPPDWTARVAAERAGTGARGEHILFLGTLEPRKNVGALIHAYGALVRSTPDAPPLVVAGRMSAHGERWRQAAESAGLGARIRFLGYVKDAARPELYARARMLVLPSFDEGFGFPVLEAMACGVPVVISNRGALPELAGDAAAPVAPDDVDGLAARMRALLDDGAAAAAAARGLRRASRYSWTACARAARGAYRAAWTARQSR